MTFHNAVWRKETLLKKLYTGVFYVLCFLFETFDKCSRTWLEIIIFSYMRRDLQKLIYSCIDHRHSFHASKLPAPSRRSFHASKLLVLQFRSTYRSHRDRGTIRRLWHVSLTVTDMIVALLRTYGHALCDINIEQFKKGGLIVRGFNLALSPAMHKNHFTLVGHQKEKVVTHFLSRH